MLLATQFLLGASAADALDRQRGTTGLLGDLAILLDNEAARGLVLFQAAEQLRRNTPVGALRAILVEDVEFVLGAAPRFLPHARRLSTKENASAHALALSKKRKSDRLQIGGQRTCRCADRPARRTKASGPR